MLCCCLAFGATGALAVEPPDYTAARSAFVTRDYATAEVRYRALLSVEPANADYLLGLGQTLLAAGRPREALVPLERARALEPAYTDVKLVLANARAALDEEARAREAMLNTLSEAPTTVHPHGELEAVPSGDDAKAFTLTTGYEVTANERPDPWYEAGIGLDYAFDRRTRIGARVARSERFGQEDNLFDVYASLPLTTRLSVSGRGQFSSTGRARVERAGFLEAAVSVGSGVVISMGGGRSVYATSSLDQLAPGIEYYVGNWRLAYSALLAKPRSIAWQAVHRFNVTNYYGDGDQLALNFGEGVETDESLLGVAAAKFDTWYLGFNGRHWLAPEFGFDYGVSYNGLQSPRGDHLDRTTFNVGIAIRF